MRAQSELVMPRDANPIRESAGESERPPPDGHGNPGAASRRVFGLLLRNRRAVAGVKAHAIARLLKMKTDALLRIERGLAPPLTDAQIERVAKYLKVDAVKLVEAATRSRPALDSSGPLGYVG